MLYISYRHLKCAIRNVIYQNYQTMRNFYDKFLCCNQSIVKPKSNNMSESFQLRSKYGQIKLVKLNRHHSWNTLYDYFNECFNCAHTSKHRAVIAGVKIIINNINWSINIIINKNSGIFDLEVLDMRLERLKQALKILKDL